MTQVEPKVLHIGAEMTLNGGRNDQGPKRLISVWSVYEKKMSREIQQQFCQKESNRTQGEHKVTRGWQNILPK